MFPKVVQVIPMKDYSVYVYQLYTSLCKVEEQMA